MFFTGGNVWGIGGGNNSHPTTQESTQGYVTYSGNVTADSTLTVSKDGTVLATFTLPYDYSRGNVILTAKGMTAGEQYTVSDGTSTQTLSAVQYGNGGAWWRRWTRWRRRSQVVEAVLWWRPRRLVNHRDHIAHRNGNPRESQSTTVYNPQSTKRPFRNDLLRKGRFILSTDDQKGGLCQSLDLTIDDVDDLTLRTLGQTRHTHDVTRNGHNHT